MNNENKQILYPVILVLVFLVSAMVISILRGQPSEIPAETEDPVNVEEIESTENKPTEQQTTNYYSITNINTLRQTKYLLGLKDDNTTTMEIIYANGNASIFKSGTWNKENNVITVTLNLPEAPQENLKLEERDGFLIATNFDKTEYGDTLVFKKGDGELAIFANFISSSNWKITKYAKASQPLTELSAGTSAGLFLSFEENSNSIAFSAKICNNISGKFTLNEDKTATPIEESTTTLMACENETLNTIESAVVRMANTGFKIDLNAEGGLVLSDQQFIIHLAKEIQASSTDQPQSSQSIDQSNPTNLYSGSIACLKTNSSSLKPEESGCAWGLYTSTNQYYSLENTTSETFREKDISIGHKVKIQGQLIKVNNLNFQTVGTIWVTSIQKE